MSQDYEKYYDQIEKEDNIFVKARLISHLKKEGLRTKDIGQRLKLQPAAVCHLLRLIRLPEIVVDGYYSHLLTASHLFIISRLKTVTDMNQAYEAILSNNLSVMQTESLIRDKLYHIKSDGTYLSNEERKKYTDRLTLGKRDVNCTVVQTRTKSQITMKMKGSLAQTTPWVKNVLALLANKDSKY